MPDIYETVCMNRRERFALLSETVYLDDGVPPLIGSAILSERVSGCLHRSDQGGRDSGRKTDSGSSLSLSYS